ncbi:BMP family ABC transporter substrate-binding protein [Mesoplasma syrphidae]|uniref:BMP family ABC transporter substrate-binding protein n=1 Tax=Mesoplasma syrphidae TaxID=225999 RepID=A0A2K9C8T9_9MOLU|nr:BMP family ABC transporter substrate-binding protein [Mesoplasma syrphidae]AUF83435.1 BMP family ABC transporter substrate-binding protein [Mesoplasma syrphidae]
MRKFTISMQAVLLGSIVSTSVVSCIKPKYAHGPAGQRVLLVTDGGNLKDKSFNESSHNAIIKYANEIDQWNNTKGLSYNAEPNYVEATDHNASAFISGYKMASFKGADAMVLAGFMHAGTIETASKLMKDKTVILADGVADYSNGKNQNVISISFNSELAGFAAAYDAAIWANQNLDKVDHHNKGVIAIGTFGGMSSKYSVDNYLWGLMLGIEVFNRIHQSDIEAKLYKKVVLANNYINNKYADVKDTKVMGPNDSRWFTQSFALGGATRSGILNRLIEHQKADVIFPVAGPQILDVMSYSNTKYLPYIIGVDTDQVNSFPGYKNRFINSAVKHLPNAISDELKRSRSLKTAQTKTGATIKVNQIDIDNLQDFPADDGTVAKTRASWSVSSFGGANLSQKTYIKISEIPDKDANYTPIKLLSETIKDEFARTGSETSQYLDGSTIAKATEAIFKLPNYQKYIHKITENGFE